MINDSVKIKIKLENQLFITYSKNGYKFNDHLHFRETINAISEVIAKRKQKLNNQATSAQTHWSV